MLGYMRRWKLSESPCYLRTMEAQYTGRGYTRLSQINSDVLYDYEEDYDLRGIPSTIAELDYFSHQKDYCVEQIMQSLKTLNDHLTNYEARRASEETSIQEEQTECAKIMLDHGIVDVLQRYLMMSMMVPEGTKDSVEDESQLRVKSLCLEIMCKIISTNVGEKLGRLLGEQDDFMNYLFTLLIHSKTAYIAAQMIEDILQARRTILNLNTIKNMRLLISEMNDNQLANLCRILAVTISDLDVFENKSSLFAQNKQKRSKGFVNVRDINQEHLLSIPNLLARLVRLATSSNYKPRLRGKSSEVDCWMEWIEDNMSEAAFTEPTEDGIESFIGGISEALAAGGPMFQQPGLSISMDLMLGVQVIYVLGLFLVGKHRKKVQRKLAELKLIPGLSQLFDNFMWKCQLQRNNLRHRLRGHNASCECSPEVALKIQFLRLVHSFCDHSDFKHLLLTRVELEEIKRINSKAGALKIEGLDDICRENMCKGNKGLLSKIIDVMKKEPTASTFRFWLARAVESYLRGSTSYCDQIFILRRGLLQHIASNMVDHDIRPKEIIQSSFDLMGELIKFNVESFKALDKVFTSRSKFDKFISVMQRNLVDSNMFIRSLMLSLEHFTNTEPMYTDYATRESWLLIHMSKVEQQMEYLIKLINIINVESLTQENVSCLNTTLVFLMFANQRSEIPKYLRLLKKNASSGCSLTGSSLMKNFRDLLRFWQDHYLHKDKDCSALEKSSRISFDYWKETVQCLVAENRDKDTSIIHYISPDDLREN